MADEEVIRSMPAMVKGKVGPNDDEGEKRSSRFMEHEVTDDLKEKSGSFELKDAEDGPQLRGGEPIIKTGADVSKYVLSSLYPYPTTS